ncbi:MAG: pantoate--beta-alanine ligase [Acidimicrobiales bacterium]
MPALRLSPRPLDLIADLRSVLDEARAGGVTVGLVPTMGALHEGHLSLVHRSVAERDVTAVTVFVNPLQFGSADDLATYPRTLEADVAAAHGAGADLVFAPPVAEMYPAGRRLAWPERSGSATTVTVDGLDGVFEGASRPGHLAGVATVVAKLFNIAGPCRAYFGEKDWQQLLVVRRLARDLSFPVEVVGCPTVREPDGLACSSRNVRLSADERRSARALHQALVSAAARVEAGERQADVVRAHLARALAEAPGVRPDYTDVVRADDLGPLERLAGPVRLLVAAHVGATRLIDNLGFTVEEAP